MKFSLKVLKEAYDLPSKIKKDISEKFLLKEDDLEIVTSSRGLYNYFRKIIDRENKTDVLKHALNIINTQLLWYMNENNIEDNDVYKYIDPEVVLQIAQLLSKMKFQAQGQKNCLKNQLKQKKSHVSLLMN